MNWKWDGLSLKCGGSISVDPDEPDWFASIFQQYTLPHAYAGVSSPVGGCPAAVCSIAKPSLHPAFGLCSPAPYRLRRTPSSRPWPCVVLRSLAVDPPAALPNIQMVPGQTNPSRDCMCRRLAHLSKNPSLDLSLVLTRIQGFPPSTTWHNGRLLFSHQG